MEGFTFGGVIISNGDVGYEGRTEEDKLMSVGNNHVGLVQVKDQWYMFYHRHTYLNQYNRQGCAEKVYFDENGHIPQVTVTTSGMNPYPLMQHDEFIRSRITELRMRKDVSEYRMSLDLDKSGSYIRGITSGAALPSLKELFDIITYFNMTPTEFFAPMENSETLYHKLCEELRTLNEEDLDKVRLFISWIEK